MPNHPQITDAFLRAAEPPATGTTTVWDGTLKHFGVRISQGGAKSFIILVGSGRRQTIGRFPTISIAQARTKAKAILAERTLGRHQPQTISWDTARDEFLALKEKSVRPRTHQEYVRTLKSYFPFGQTRLGEVTKADIAKKLDKLNDTPSQRDHALVVAKLFFNWCIKQGYLDTNPTLASSRRKTKRRTRILSDAELQLIWRACEQSAGLSPEHHSAAAHQVINPQGNELRPSTMPTHFATIVKLLILCGQRRGETAALRASYYSHNQQTIRLPSELTKNGIEHTFPVGTLAQSLLTTTSSEATSGLLFPARGKTNSPFNGWSKSKKALDELSGVTAWTLHDIRRTFRSNLGKLGVLPHIAERLVNHISAQTDMEQTYDQYKYMPEMRDAIERWEAHLLEHVAV